MKNYTVYTQENNTQAINLVRFILGTEIFEPTNRKLLRLYQQKAGGGKYLAIENAQGDIVIEIVEHKYHIGFVINVVRLRHVGTVYIRKQKKATTLIGKICEISK